MGPWGRNTGSTWQIFSCPVSYLLPSGTVTVTALPLLQSSSLPAWSMHGFVDGCMAMITAEAFRPRLTQFLSLLSLPFIHCGLDCKKWGAYHFIWEAGKPGTFPLIIGAQNFRQLTRIHKPCSRNMGGCTVGVSVCVCVYMHKGIWLREKQQ